MEIRTFLWGLLLVGIIIYGPVFLYGCATNERVDQARQERALHNSEYKYAMIYLGYPSVYLLKFEGHDYLTRGGDSYMIHTVSCPGVHGPTINLGANR